MREPIVFCLNILRRGSWRLVSTWRGKTPEASLSLLYPDANPHLLSGKTIPVEKTEAMLLSGKKLTPETCGWHYVEGLTLDDNPELALFWCKEPLGHNGELRDGHIVWKINTDKEFIPLDEWDQFLKDQKELRSQIDRKVEPEVIEE